MERYFLILVVFFSLAFQNSKSNEIDSAYIYNTYSKIARQIIQKAMADSSAWEKLAYVCDTYGPRLTGSKSLNDALFWAEKEMKKDGFENVHLEEVMVPNWKRGEEYCEMVYPRNKVFKISSLGHSVGTNGKFIEGPVLVVKDFDELAKRSKEVKGKIVVYNAPWVSYGHNVQYRFNGASEAAKYGAIASLVRSVSPIGFDMLHTGVMGYQDSIPKIPTASITLEDAELLQRLQNRGITPKLKLKMTCETMPDTISYNLMGEIKGSEKPQEIVALGGHSDSWDYGEGAQDDASGFISTWQALNIIHSLGLKPRRTMRNVMWVNEESGTRGGIAYAEKHKSEPHFLVFEFDSGVFEPLGIGFTGDEKYLTILKGITPLIKEIAPDFSVKKGGGGVDIGPMMKLGISGMALSTKGNDEYFWYHHSPADTPDKVNPENLNKCIAVIAIATYIYADLPDFISTK
jgi:carboxypeptidase Q